jgi:hypothetical protein
MNPQHLSDELPPLIHNSMKLVAAALGSHPPGGLVATGAVAVADLMQDATITMDASRRMERWAAIGCW